MQSTVNPIPHSPYTGRYYDFNYMGMPPMKGFKVLGVMGVIFSFSFAIFFAVSFGKCVDYKRFNEMVNNSAVLHELADDLKWSGDKTAKFQKLVVSLALLFFLLCLLETVLSAGLIVGIYKFKPLLILCDLGGSIMYAICVAGICLSFGIMISIYPLTMKIFTPVFVVQEFAFAFLFTVFCLYNALTKLRVINAMRMEQQARLTSTPSTRQL